MIVDEGAARVNYNAIEIESDNVLVVQSFILILFINTAKHQEAAVILLTRAHCYAAHYLSQYIVGSVANQSAAFVIERY